MADRITRINLEPDKPALDGRHLDKLIELWKEDLHRRVKLVSYRSNVSSMNIFSAWWDKNSHGYDWLVNEATMTEFVDYLSTYRTRWGRDMSVHSQINVVKVVKALLRWAFTKGYVGLDFSHFVPAVKGSADPKEVVKLDELHTLIRFAGISTYGKRNQAVVAVMAGTGVRCIECAALQIGDVSLTSDLVGTIHLRITKGDKPRVVAFDRFTGGYLSTYLETVAGRMPTSPLFTTRYGRAFTRLTMGKLIAQIATRANLDIRAHDLRRMFATHWARERTGAGYDQLLTKQMGHSDIKMTSQYMLQDVQDLVTVMRNEAISPMAALHDYKNGSTR